MWKEWEERGIRRKTDHNKSWLESVLQMPHDRTSCGKKKIQYRKSEEIGGSTTLRQSSVNKQKRKG